MKMRSGDFTAEHMLTELTERLQRENQKRCSALKQEIEKLEKETKKIDSLERNQIQILETESIINQSKDVCLVFN